MDPTFHAFQSRVEDWHWWYAVRRDILDQMLRQLELDRGHARLLDIGSGTGGSALVLSQHGRAIAVDRSPDSFRLSMDRPYAHRIVAAADGPLPFSDHSFDVVCALDILEHLSDDRAAMREIHRVLKPGGTAIVFVPALNWLWGENDDYSHLLRRYVEPELVECVKSAGLAIETSGYFNLLLLPPTAIARLVQRVLPQRLAHAVEHSERPSPFNGILRSIFRLELPLVRRSRIPLGTSTYCVARKG